MQTYDALADERTGVARTTHVWRGVRPCLAALALVVLAGCAQQRHEAAWDDLVTARQQDAIDRGWVPEWLPEAATDVVEADRPSTAEVVMRATLPDDVPVDACSPDEDLPEPPRDLAPSDGPWEPEPQGLRLACEDGWSAIRADDTIWAWATEPTLP